MIPTMLLNEIAAKAESLDLDHAEYQRYGRHLTLPQVGPQGQKRLKASRVLLVGAGGLGSPLALYLAAAGVGTLGLVDDDEVDASNLQRQVLYGHSDVGRPKLEAAAERLRDVNPHVNLELHQERLNADNAQELVAAYDLVADGTDNFPTRYLVNDACVLVGRPNVWGAILRFEGQLSVFWAEHGPCYRCLFPEPPPPGLVPSCAEGGVLGVLPGIIGSLQANEVIKLLLGEGEPMIGRLLLFDALKLRFRELKLRRSPECPICSDEPRITSLVAYSDACETTEDSTKETDQPAEVDMSDENQMPHEITVEQLKSWLDEERELTIVDVREPHEHQIGMIDGAVEMPMGQIVERWQELPTDRPCVVVCHHGPRAIRTVGYLRQQGLSQATNLGGGMDAWSLRIDPAVPRY